MIKTLTPHGEAYALVIDKQTMDLLNITPETPLEITTDGRSLTVSPASDTDRAEEIANIRKEMLEEYADTFRKLAE